MHEVLLIGVKVFHQHLGDKITSNALSQLAQVNIRSQNAILILIVLAVLWSVKGQSSKKLVDVDEACCRVVEHFVAVRVFKKNYRIVHVLWVGMNTNFNSFTNLK